MKVRAKKLTKGSLYKILFIGIAVPMLPFTLICGIASLFGAQTVWVNEKPVTGIMGLVAAVPIYIVVCVVFSCAMWIACALGLWMYSLCRKIELELVDGEIVRPNGQAD